MAKKESSKARPTLSGQVREVIESKGLSLDELEKLSGVHATVIGRFVAGKREVRSGTLDRLAAVLDVRLVEVAPAKPRGKGRPAKSAAG